MARPTFTPVDLWTRAISYGDRTFGYLREKLPDYDGEKRFFVYTAHERIPDRLWVGSFVKSSQAALWAEWHAIELMAATAAEGDEARRLARELAEKPHGFYRPGIIDQAAR